MKAGVARTQSATNTATGANATLAHVTNSRRISIVAPLAFDTGVTALASTAKTNVAIYGSTAFTLFAFETTSSAARRRTTAANTV